MRTLILMPLLFMGLIVHSQEVEGLWYNEASDYFLELNKNSCTMTSRWHRGQDSIGYFRNDHEYKLRYSSEEIKLKSSYYTNGLAFWKRSDKYRYWIDVITEELMILKPNGSNDKHEGELLGNTGEGNKLRFRKISAEFYFKHTGLELKPAQLDR